MTLDSQQQFLHGLQQVIDKIKACPRHCMCKRCNKETLKYSHVLSKSQILKPISRDSKIYQFEYRPLYFLQNQVQYQLKGINHAFSFKGFCSVHDNDLFVSIEPSRGYVDWSDVKNQYLLGYRTLCRELSIQEIVYDINEHLLNYSESDYPSYKFDLYLRKENLLCSANTLNHYKTMLENGIFDGDYTGYRFEHIELPFQFDLCVCSPIYVDDGRGVCFKYNYQESNIVMIFPYCGKTEIIIGYSKDFDNVWMNHILPEFKSFDPLRLSRAFANVLYRAEFNAMSPALYEALNPDLVKLFFDSFMQNASVYSLDINGVEDLFLEPLRLLCKD